MFVIFLVFLMLQGCNGVIYSLNSSEYSRMPPLFSLDDYRACMSDAQGIYCLLDLDLFSNEPSDLMHLIHEYSADTKKHFNHTQIHRGVCVTRRCIHTNNTTMDLNTSLEACLNETIWSNYNLQTKLNNINYCNSADARPGLDASDLAVIIVYMILLALNIIGSLYDLFFCHPSSKSGNPYVLSFSLRRNWAKLVAPSSVGTDPRFERLKLFQGLRAMTMVCVIFSHVALIIGYSYIENPQYIEKSFEDPSKQILFNGNLVTHTFFVMSAFLLAYNFEVNAERHKVSLWDFPKGVLLRLIRLTPTYALVLATSATVLRRVGSGPMWDMVVNRHADDCRRYWWAHMLYVQNYMSTENTCLLESWYLAADTQLFCVGLLTCLLCRRPRAKRLALVSLFLLSLVITASTTYFMELDPIVYQSPETIRSLYTRNWTFRYMYIQGHTNLSTYLLGLAGGFLTYHWQMNAKDMEKYKKYRCVVWALLPLALLLILSGDIFYMDVDTVPIAFKLIYATLYKPLFQLMVVTFIMSCVFKIESVYRCIVEWRGFTWGGRLTYGAYLLHTTFQRGLFGSQVQTIYISEYNVLVALTATVFISALTSGALWLCVEAPVAALSKAIFAKKKQVEP